MKTLMACAAILGAAHAAPAAIMFTPGNYYSANYFSKNITQYDALGNVVGSITVPTVDEVRGLQFGPDGLLYAGAVKGSGAAVVALNSSGAVVQTYPFNVYAFGNLSYGKVAVDQQYVYLTAQNSLIRFEINNPASATVIYTNNQLYDVKILPNGHLLAASAYEVEEITTSGAYVRDIEPGGGLYTDVRGVEYDPVTNNMFVTHLGHSGFFFQIMRVDFATGALEESVSSHYADDLFITRDGNLLVGSRTLPPKLFTQDLDPIGQLGTSERMFITQNIPEPGSALALTTIVAARILRRRR